MAGTSRAINSPSPLRPFPSSRLIAVVTATETAIDAMVSAVVASGTPVCRISFRSILVFWGRFLRERIIPAIRSAGSASRFAPHLSKTRLPFAHPQPSRPRVLDDRLNDLPLVDEVLDVGGPRRAGRRI